MVEGSMMKRLIFIFAILLAASLASAQTGTTNGSAYFTGSSTFTTVTPPTVNGLWFLLHNVTGSASVPPSAVLSTGLPAGTAIGSLDTGGPNLTFAPNAIKLNAGSGPPGWGGTPGSCSLSASTLGLTCLSSTGNRPAYSFNGGAFANYLLSTDTLNAATATRANNAMQPVTNVSDAAYGAVADQRTVTDLVTTAGSATATSATAAFTTADNSRIIEAFAGSAGFGAGTYTSGGSISGTTGQTCTLSSFNGGGSGATGTVALTGASTIAGGTGLNMITFGSGYTTSPTSATLGSGTATCSGTATIAATTLVYAPIVTTITYVNSTTITMGANAVYAVSGGTANIGTDNATAFGAAVTAAYASTTLPTFYVPAGNYMYSSGLTFPNPVDFQCATGSMLNYVGTGIALNFSGSFTGYLAPTSPYTVNGCGFTGAQRASDGIYMTKWPYYLRFTNNYVFNFGNASIFEMHLAGEQEHADISLNQFLNNDSILQGGGWFVTNHNLLKIEGTDPDSEIYFHDNRAACSSPNNNTVFADGANCLVGIWQVQGISEIVHNDMAFWNPIFRQSVGGFAAPSLVADNSLETNSLGGGGNMFEFGDPSSGGAAGGLKIINNHVYLGPGVNFLAPAGGNASATLAYTLVAQNTCRNSSNTNPLVTLNNLAAQTNNFMYSNQGCPQTTPSGSNITPWGFTVPGNLGIGTLAPNYPLDIEGNAAAELDAVISNNSTSGIAGLRIGIGITPGTLGTNFDLLYTGSGATVSAPMARNQGIIQTGGSAAGGLMLQAQEGSILFVTNGYPGTQRGQFDSSGNFDVGSSSQFQVNSSGILKSYNNLATVGDGQPYTVAHDNVAAFSTSQSGNVLASPVANHAYKLHYYMWQAASGTGTCSTNSTATLALTWNDPSATAQTQTFTALQIPPTLAAGAWQSGDLDVVTASGTAIAYSITYVNGNCATTQPTVQAQVWAEASN